MIDMHTHWRPAEFTDALRARTKEPRVVRNQDGVEVLKTRMGEEPLAKAFDEVDFHLARMDRQGVSTSVLSLLGSFCWIEAQRHARHAGEPFVGDGHVVPHRLPRALPRCDDPGPQPGRQHSVRDRAHGPPVSARYTE